MVLFSHYGSSKSLHSTSFSQNVYFPSCLLLFLLLNTAQYPIYEVNSSVCILHIPSVADNILKPF